MSIRICFITLFALGNLLINSCDKGNDTLRSEMLVGTWNLNEVTINQINGSALAEDLNTSSIFVLNEDRSYYRNYVNGTWNFNKTSLDLSPTEDLGILDWNYEIVEINNDILKLKISLTEGQYYGDFEEFNGTEILQIEETYDRQK